MVDDLSARIARMHHLLEELDREAGENERLSEAFSRLRRELEAAHRTLRHQLALAQRAVESDTKGPVI